MPTGDGDADATVRATSSATKLWKYWRKQNKLIPDIVDETEVNDGELRYHIKSFCDWASSTIIPAFFDENLQPRQDNSKRVIDGPTIILYIGKYLLHIRRKFPSLPDFKGLVTMKDHPSWWKDQRNSFLKKYERFKLDLPDDILFGTTETFPLYRCNGCLYSNTELSRISIKNYLDCIDGNSIVDKMVRNANGLPFTKGHPRSHGLFQQRCWIVYLHNAIGRAGEVRFPNYNDWILHGPMQILKTYWTEMKTRTKYSMPIIHHRDCWRYDMFHALGCYWAVEKGLVRSSEEVKMGLTQVVFPDLYKIKKESVPKKITAAIRNNLPDNTPTHVIELFSGRSIRQGSITEAFLNPDVSLAQGCARSGHSTGTTVDSYIDNTNVLFGIQAARALSGYKTVNDRDVLPRLDALGFQNHQSVHCYIQNLFEVSLEDFLQGNRLFPVLMTVTATLILHFPSILNQFGRSNAIVSCMIKAAVKAEIVDARATNCPFEDVLELWSNDIRDDLQLRICDGMKVVPELHSIAEGMNLVLLNQSKLLASKSKNDIQLRELNSKMLSQQSTIKGMSSENVYLKQVVEKLQTKLEVFRTPTTGTKKRKFVVEGDQDSEHDSIIDDSLNPSDLFQSKDTPVVPLNLALKDTSVSKVNGKPAYQSALSKETLLERVLVELAKQKRLDINNFKNVDIANSELKYQKSRLLYCMELIGKATTKLERKELVSADSDNEKLKAADKIVSKSFDLLYELEGKDPDVEKKNSAGRSSTSYEAMGKRVGNLKLLIAKKIGLDPSNKIALRAVELKKLHEIEDINQPPGTPKDNRSIRNFFASGGTSD